MNIIFISPECFPYAKDSQLSDYLFSLARTIEKEGHNLKIFLPRYGSIDPQNFLIEMLPNEFNVNFKGSDIPAIAYKGILKDSLVSVFFIDNQNHFSNSKEIYTNEEIDSERFSFFSSAVFTLISKLKLLPDVIHLFNPYSSYFTNYIKNFSGSERPGIVFTLYNPCEVRGETLTNTKKLIELSDITNTTSSTYAHELKEGIYKTNFDGALKLKKERFFGFLSGVDKSMFNPEEDNFIAQKYASNYFSIGKKKCKEELLRNYNLEEDSQYPLFGMIGKLSKEEGVDLLLSSLPLLSNFNLQFLIHGKGDLSYEKELAKASQKYKNIRFISGYEESIVKKIYAGCDFIVSPGVSEHSGLTSLNAMAYGTVPVVYEVSTIKEIISDLEDIDGNAITFQANSKDEFLNAVNRAINYYKNKQEWPKLVKHIMNVNLTIEQCAKKYINCYERIRE